MDKLFTVVKFLKDNSVDYVPTKWINASSNKATVKFPKQKNSKACRILADPSSSPNPVWPEWDIEVIKSYDTIERAEDKVEKYANYQSESSGTEGSSKQRKKKPCLEEVVVSPPETSVHSEFPEVPEDGAHNFDSTADDLPQFFNDGGGNSFVIPLEIGNHPTLEVILSEQRAFQAKALENQEILIREQKETKAILLNFLSKHASSNLEPTAGHPEDFGTLIPLKSEENLARLEEKLQDQDCFNKLVQRLGPLGRNEISRTTYAVLSYLFELNFSKTVRYTSQSGKIPLQSTKLVEVVRTVVRSNHLTAKEREIELCIQAWFRYSPDRGGGRKRKNGNSSEVSAPQSTTSSSAVPSADS